MDQRNELHHGSLPIGDKADELVREARERFERCVEEAMPIWQHPLRLVLDYDAFGVVIAPWRRAWITQGITLQAARCRRSI
jgi:hypothetical protein